MKTMMKMIAAMLIAVMLLTGAAMAAGKIRTDGRAHVRRGADAKYATVNTVKAGKVLSFDKAKKDARGVTWYHVKGGWVSAKEAVKVNTANAAKKAGRNNIIATRSGANIRKGPGTSYAVIAKTARGATANFLGEKVARNGHTWLKISYNGTCGWVDSKYVKLR